MYLETSNPVTVHFRYIFNESDGSTVTECRIHHGMCQAKGCELEDVGIEIAVCSPKDMFVKRLGRRLALTRAVKNLPKTVRTEIWEKYFEKAPAK